MTESGMHGPYHRRVSMRLHEDAIRASVVPTNVIYNKQFSIPRSWTISEDMRKIHEEIESWEESHDQWLRRQFGLAD